MSITIAVSGINAIDNPGPGTGVAKSLKNSNLDVRIIGFAYDAMEPGIYMDWIIDKCYIMPYPSAGIENFLQRLKNIQKIENIDIFISNLDAELPLLMKIEKELLSIGIKTMFPEEEAFNRRNKDKLHEFAKEIKLKVPETLTMTDPLQIDEAINKYGFPLMIKGLFYEAYKVFSRPQALEKFHIIAANWGYPVLAQKHIIGDEYNLIGLGNGKGDDLGHLAIKKMSVTKLGKTWTNVSIKSKEIEKIALKMVKLLKWRGGYELELMRETSTNKLYLIEINPRFPAWIYMSTGCGINLCERMVQLLLNQEYETHSNYPTGKMMIRFTDEIIVDLEKFDKLSTMAES